MAFNAATGYAGIANESVPGTPTAPDLFYPFQEIDIDFQDELIEWQEMRGSRQAKQAQDGPLRPSVTASGAVYPAGAFGALLKGLFGSVTSGAVGASITAYQHVYGDASELPSFSVERATGFSDDGGTVFAERIAGCKVESLGLEMSFGEQVTFNTTLQATKVPDAGVTPVTRAAAVYPDVSPLYFQGAAVNVNGAPNSRFKSLSVEFTNTLERQETLNGERAAYSIFEGAFEATLSGTMVFEDTVYYDYLLQGTEITAEVSCTNGDVADAAESADYGLTLAYPRLRLTRHSVPFSAGSTVEADVEFAVLFDTSTNTIVTPTLVNTEDGLSY